jgi:sugar lactone lactonase YvrE
MPVRRVLAWLLAAIVLLLVVAAVRSPVDSVAWNPPAAPEPAGVLAPNERLAGAELLALGQIRGPEDVDVDAEGRVYAGLDDGRIVRILADGSVEEFANTAGRPLGLEFDAGGRLIVADAWKGLLSISSGGQVSVLATEAEGVPFGFTDDVDVARNGIIYFSDASSRWRQPDYELDLLETRPWGRLLAYDPNTRETRVLLKDLYFANGVALSSNEDFVLVNETWRYRVLRYWLAGPRAGQSEVFADNLPGFPDGISGNRKGVFWLALPSPRKGDLDALHALPLLKEIVAGLPQFLRPKAVRYGMVLALDENGHVLASLHDTGGEHLREITSVEQAGDFIYFGSLSNDRIGRMEVIDALPR